MFIELIFDKALAEPTLVIVERRVNHRPIDVDQFPTLVIFVEYNRSVFQLLIQVVVAEGQFINSGPIMGHIFIFVKSMQWHLFDLYLYLLPHIDSLLLVLLLFGFVFCLATSCDVLFVELICC